MSVLDLVVNSAVQAGTAVLRAERRAGRAVRAARPAGWLPGERLPLWMSCWVLFLVALVAACRRGPWEPDELKYALVVRSMRSGGSLLVPELWGELYSEKPPVYFWLVLGSAALWGQVGLSALLTPVVLAACLHLWLIWYIGKQWFGRAAGSVAPVFLASLPLFVIGSLVGRMDMLLSLSVTAASWLLFRGYFQRRPLAVVAAWGCMGAGFLIKGPFGLLLPLAVCVLALWLRGRLGRMWSLSTAAGFAVCVAMVAVWAVPVASTLGLTRTTALLDRQLLRRSLVGVDHGQPFWFYLVIIPPLLLPWSGQMAAACRRRWQQGVAGSDRETFLWCWALLPVVIMSLVREKAPLYLLPIMPPVALILAQHWVRPSTDGGSARRVSLAMQAVYLAGALAGLALILISGWCHGVQYSVGTVLSGGVCLVLMAGLGLAGSRRACTRRDGYALGTLAAITAIGALFLVAVLAPRFDSKRSWRAVARVVNQARRPTEQVVVYQMRPYIAYYVHQQVFSVRSARELTQLVHQHGSVCCAMRCAHMGQLDGVLRVKRLPGGPYPTPKGPVAIFRMQPL